MEGYSLFFCIRDISMHAYTRIISFEDARRMKNIRILIFFSILKSFFQLQIEQHVISTTIVN